MSPCTLKLPKIVVLPSTSKRPVALKLPPTIARDPVSLIILSPTVLLSTNLVSVFAVPLPSRAPLLVANISSKF